MIDTSVLNDVWGGVGGSMTAHADFVRVEFSNGAVIEITGDLAHRFHYTSAQAMGAAQAYNQQLQQRQQAQAALENRIQVPVIDEDDLLKRIKENQQQMPKPQKEDKDDGDT